MRQQHARGVRMSGLILPAGSPLVQFEVQRLHEGDPPSAAKVLPFIVWANRNASRACRYECDGREFVVPMEIANPIREAVGLKPYKVDPAVCSSTGRFVE